MPYNSIISRSDAENLIPEGVSRQIVQGAVEQSTVLRLAQPLPNMPSNKTKMPVLSVLPQAYFVTGDTGLKQTSRQAWANKFINAEELAVIVPIPESVLDDADYDIWGEVKPRIEEAFGVAIDASILFGTDAPAEWPDDIFTAATAASHVVDHSTDAQTDYFDEILGVGGVFSMVEADGFMVTGSIAATTMKAALRGLRDSTGQPIFMRSMQDRTRYELDGEPIEFPRNGAFDATSTLLISGDFKQIVYSYRQDITYKVLDQAVLTDNAGNIIFNLAQQDMVALRAVMRIGWQLPNPINRMNTNEATRYPFALLVP